MAEEKLTTIQIDQETDRKLKAIAAALVRSKAAQIRYWVNREYAELERFKLLPAEIPEEPALKPIVE
jgi:hypothetical protein